MRRLPLRSPPRMRGKVIVRSRNAVQIGITPAYAGKSARILKRRTEKRDHPRVCGEKSLVMRWMSRSMGSPPRMRGKASCVWIFARLIGITPAYAGKSCPFLRRTSPRRDHPRVCGEKIWLSSVCVHASGSPPRMRGKVPGLLLQHLTHGITPAYAGKSLWLFQGLGPRQDHPRVCGEKSFKTSTSCGYKGSPPRMRGKGGS